MKVATSTQVIEAAKTYGPVGRDSVKGMYAVVGGEKKYFGRKLYRDSLHNLATAGELKYNGDFTYSVAR